MGYVSNRLGAGDQNFRIGDSTIPLGATYAIDKPDSINGSVASAGTGETLAAKILAFVKLKYA